MVDDKDKAPGDKTPAQKPAAPPQAAPAKAPEKTAAAPAAPATRKPTTPVAGKPAGAKAATPTGTKAATPQKKAAAPAESAAAEAPKKKRRPVAEETAEEEEDVPEEPPRAPPNKTLQLLTAPFVFMGTIIGFILVAAAPIVYVNEILQYFKKESQWPGWTTLDGLNYAFFDSRLYVYGQHVYYKGDAGSHIVFKFSSAVLTQYINVGLCRFLDSSVILVSLVTGGLLMYFSIRAALLTQKN